MDQAIQNSTQTQTSPIAMKIIAVILILIGAYVAITAALLFPELTTAASSAFSNTSMFILLSLLLGILIICGIGLIASAFGLIKMKKRALIWTTVILVLLTLAAVTSNLILNKTQSTNIVGITVNAAILIYLWSTKKGFV